MKSEVAINVQELESRLRKIEGISPHSTMALFKGSRFTGEFTIQQLTAPDQPGMDRDGSMRPLNKIIGITVISGFFLAVILGRLIPFPGSDLLYALAACATVLFIIVHMIEKQYAAVDEVFVKTVGKPAPAGFPAASHELCNHIISGRVSQDRMHQALAAINNICAQKVDQAAATIGNSSLHFKQNLTRLESILGTYTEAIQRIAESLANTTAYTEKTTERTMESAEALAASSEKIKNMMSVIDASSGEILKLEELTKKIEESTNLIDTIASQTNLLALNAAIEAARAGEAGRGFSVVADEVRKLAEHSTKTAKDINPKIHAIRDAVGQSTEKLSLVHQIAQELNDATINANKGASVVMGAISNIEGQVSLINKSMDQIKDSNTELEQLSSACGGYTQPLQEALAQIMHHLSELDKLSAQGELQQVH